MRNSLRVLTVVSCLLMATASFAQTKPLPAQSAPGSSDAAKQSINYVEIIQLDAKTQIFNAKLVNVNTGMVVLEVSGKGTELQDFQKKSTGLAPREQTVTLTGPWAHTADIIIKPPNPPGPAGGDLLHLANQVARSYDLNLAQQMKLTIQPSQIRPGALDPRIQPGVQPSVANPNAQPTAPAQKK